MIPASLAMRMWVSIFRRALLAWLTAMLFQVTAARSHGQGALVDVELAELPVADALKLLARQAGLDVQIDEALEKTGVRTDKLPWGPPQLKLQLKQVTAEQVLESVVGAYGLVMDKSRGAGLIKLRFAQKEELVFKGSPRLLPDPLKNQRQTPLMFFDEAPLLQVVQTLALQSRLNLLPSHELLVGTNAQGVAWSEAIVTFKVRNVTPQQALEAVLEANGLVVDWSALGQVGVIYPAQRFAQGIRLIPVKPPGSEEKTDLALADLAVEDFVQLLAGQMSVNWTISAAARQATGADKQPVLQAPVSLSQKGITLMEALQQVLKSKGLVFRWNGRTGIGVVDVVK